jgi:hypothetical protein
MAMRLIPAEGTRSRGGHCRLCSLTGRARPPRTTTKLVSLSSLVAQGFEVETVAGNQAGVIGTLVLQKGADVFPCDAEDLPSSRSHSSAGRLYDRGCGVHQLHKWVYLSQCSRARRASCLVGCLLS